MQGEPEISEYLKLLKTFTGIFFSYQSFVLDKFVSECWTQGMKNSRDVRQVA